MTDTEVAVLHAVVDSGIDGWFRPKQIGASDGRID